MNTLIFNGSPRRNGDTAALIDEFSRYVKGRKIRVDTYYSGIAFCNDCRRCRTMPGCSIKDAMLKLYEQTRECDVAVIASPVNFSMLTGSLLGVFSRFQSWYCNEKYLNIKQDIKPKKGVILLAGGGDGKPDDAVKTARALLRSIGVRGEIDVLMSVHTDELPAAEDISVKARIKETAQKLYG